MRGSDVPDDVTDLDDFSKFSIGSKQPACSLDQIHLTHSNDVAFGNFRTRLNTFLSTQLGFQVRLTAESVVNQLHNLLSLPALIVIHTGTRISLS